MQRNAVALAAMLQPQKNSQGARRCHAASPLHSSRHESLMVLFGHRAAAGFAETQFGRIPKIQILTVEGLLDHREFARLPAIDPGAFRKAPKEAKAQQTGFDFEDR